MLQDKRRKDAIAGCMLYMSYAYRREWNIPYGGVMNVADSSSLAD